jgi:hypothetical protein
MIDLLTKLPDSALGVLMAGTAWFGFNYAVLAERAMQSELVAPARAACLAELESDVPAPIPRSRIGELFGMPELDALEARLVEQAMPPMLTEAQKLARCSCVVAGSSPLRFEYAVHTASFRIIPASEAASFRQQVAARLSGPCA